MSSPNKRVHSLSQQKEKDTASLKKELRLKCINRACKSGRNLTDAIKIACDFYQVPYKKSKKVCIRCLNKCINQHKHMVNKFQSGGCIYDIKYPKYDRHCVIESSSSEDEEEENQQQPMPSTSKYLSNNEDATSADIINRTVETFFVDNEARINDQLTLCKKHILDKKQKRSSEMCSLEKMASNLKIKVNALRNKLYEPYTPILNVVETVDLGTLDKSFLKSTTNKTKDPNIDNNVVISITIENDLPADQPGHSSTLEYPPLKRGDTVYVCESSYLEPWKKAKIISVINKDHMFVYTFKGVKHLYTVKEIAYYTLNSIRFQVGTRVIAKLNTKYSSSNSDFSDDFYAGVIGEEPGTINTFRYFIFFDNGIAQYQELKYIRLILHKSSCVANDVHPNLQEFIKSYLEKYPVCLILKLTDQKYVRAKYRNKWELAKVVKEDASLVLLYFTELHFYEWVYRGSARLRSVYDKQNKSDQGIRSSQSPLAYLNKPHGEYTSLKKSVPKNTARKSTSKSSTSNSNQIEKNVVNQHNLYEIKTIKLPESVPRPKNYTIHNCNHSCVDRTAYDHKDTNKISMLATPLHFGFQRLYVRVDNTKECCIIYKTPCGRTIENTREMFYYLIITESKITIDLFDFNICVNPLREFNVLECNIFMQDLSNGEELKGISVVNNIDRRLPPPLTYLNSRQAMPGVELNLDNDFLCGCDCTDNCQDKSKCACWQLTIEGHKVLPISYNDQNNIGYNYRRLPEHVITGIYECNANCKCSSSCLNRVVQYPLSQKLQLFLTEKKGWGVRCLNDIPQGSFICVYVGYLLTENDANERGKNYGDEYLAELDYIEVVEKLKEDYESDVPISSKEESDNDDSFNTSDTSDEDYQITSEGKSSTACDMSLRKCIMKSTKTKSGVSNVPSKSNSGNMKSNPEPSKSVRGYFGANESVYIMDAKTSGNIGRYLNHSCCPNTFVQNVFVDTHDPRFPWISIFALHHIEAGTELTWDYNYEVGSVPGKELKCYCASANCRGRLL